MTWEELKREADYARATRSSGSDYVFSTKRYGLDLTAKVGSNGLVVVNLNGETRLQDAVGLFGKAVLSEAARTVWSGQVHYIYDDKKTLEGISLEGMKNIHLQRSLFRCMDYVSKIACMITGTKHLEGAGKYFSALANAVPQADFSKMELTYELHARDNGEGYMSLIDLSGIDENATVNATYNSRPDGRALDWLVGK